jgi:hypothetical protein
LPSNKLLKIFDYYLIIEIDFCRENFHNPYLSDDILS